MRHYESAISDRFESHAVQYSTVCSDRFESHTACSTVQYSCAHSMSAMLYRTVCTQPVGNVLLLTRVVCFTVVTLVESLGGGLVGAPGTRVGSGRKIAGMEYQSAFYARYCA